MYGPVLLKLIRGRVYFIEVEIQPHQDSKIFHAGYSSSIDIITFLLLELFPRLLVHEVKCII